MTGQRVRIDYKKINKATRKDHFLLSFVDQMLDRLARKYYYYFLDGYMGQNQITIALKDQEKTTFTCPHDTFAFRKMPFELCNALTTFYRTMIAIFLHMVEKFIEVFVNDFSIFGESYDGFSLIQQRCYKDVQRQISSLTRKNVILWLKKIIMLGHNVFI